MDQYCKIVVVGTDREFDMRFGFLPRHGEFVEAVGDVFQVDSVRHIHVAGSKSEVVIEVFPPESE